ncbi:hypothetical protein [Kitasatospora sp. P5_F3]
MPRTTWQRLNRAKTDSGWPLLLINFCYFAVLLTLTLTWTASGTWLYVFPAVALGLGLLRTGYVILCVAQGKTGLTAPAATAAAPRGGRHL